MHSKFKVPLLVSVACAAALTGMALRSRRERMLEEYHRAVQEKTASLKEADGWTADGYIKDQDHFYHRIYRQSPASGNGCGPVAAFDLRHHAGQSVRFPDVLDEMSAMHLRNVPGPTTMRVMRRYLSKYLHGWREVHGRSAALAAAKSARMGVLRYHEESVPHFIPFFHADGDRFRFFNVSDGQEDFTATWDEFAAGHIRGGSVKLIYWE